MESSKIQFGENLLVLNYTEKSGLFKVKRKKKIYANEITLISIETCVEKVWFNTYLSEKIAIKTTRSANKVVYYGIKEFDNFEDYKNGLRIFARTHNVPLRDMVRF